MLISEENVGIQIRLAFLFRLALLRFLSFKVCEMTSCGVGIVSRLDPQSWKPLLL